MSETAQWLHDGVLRPSVTAAGHAIVCERDEYRIGYEQCYGMTVGHMDVFKWSPSVARQLIEDVEVLMEMRSSPIYIPISHHDLKLMRFVELLGFEYVVDEISINGTLYRLYARMPQRELEAA